MQLVYDLLAVSVIYSSSADRIIHLGQHMILLECYSQVIHCWLLRIVLLSENCSVACIIIIVGVLRFHFF